VPSTGSEKSSPNFPPLTFACVRIVSFVLAPVRAFPYRFVQTVCVGGDGGVVDPDSEPPSSEEPLVDPLDPVEDPEPLELPEPPSEPVSLLPLEEPDVDPDVGSPDPEVLPEPPLPPVDEVPLPPPPAPEEDPVLEDSPEPPPTGVDGDSVEPQAAKRTVRSQK
jgi:hypothetical protein